MTVLFLDAQDAELVRRYDATRRKHPLAAEADGLVESIELERSLLDGTRDAADLVIDTSELNIHQLKERLVAAFDDATHVAAAGRRGELRVQARPAARRRHRDGRALPAQPALGGASCAR